MMCKFALSAVWLSALVPRVYAQAFAPPAYDGERITDVEGLDVRTTAAVDPQVSWAIARVCSVAAGVYRDELGLAGPDLIDIYVSTTDEHWASVVTDRAFSIYIVYNEETGIGEQERKYPQPVGILCKAVAELFNRHRVPGLERYVSAIFAVPAVSESEGDTAWPRPYPYVLADGPDLFGANCYHEDFLRDHPDWAAASALWQVTELLGVEWLAGRLGLLEADGAEALQQIREGAVGEDRALDDVFLPWDQATDLSRDADGSLVLTSFETEEEMDVLDYRAGIELTTSTEWSTHGERSAVITFVGPTPWPMLAVFDEDWRYKDWSPYASLEFDVRNPGDTAVDLWCEAHDTPDRAHATGYDNFQIAPGEDRHCSLPTRLPLPWRTAVYFEGQGRSAEIAGLLFCVPGPPEPPVALWIDNIRLRP